ncbi:unnamed protein product, partial [Symbiodinium necroappetens]
QVVRSWFEPPDDETACSCSCWAELAARCRRSISESCWSQVVLMFDGHVRGVQFDRFGAVWFRGVELLRTTTPEPSPSGIEWHVERDITDFQIPGWSFTVSGSVLHCFLGFAFRGNRGVTLICLCSVHRTTQEPLSQRWRDDSDSGHCSCAC